MKESRKGNVRDTTMSRVVAHFFRAGLMALIRPTWHCVSVITRTVISRGAEGGGGIAESQCKGYIVYISSTPL